MKIDTSTIRMTSNEYYREKTDSERNTTIRFWDIVNGQKGTTTEKTLHEKIQYQDEWKTENSSELKNSDTLEHPLAFARNYGKASYLRSTSMNQLLALGEDLSDEQREALSDRAKKQMDLVNQTKNFQCSSIEGGLEFKPLEPQTPPIFEPTGSVVSDIETMVGWIEEAVELRDTFFRSSYRQSPEQVENHAKSDYMQRTAIDNLVAMGGGLSEEQFDSLSEKSKELVRYYLVTRSEAGDNNARQGCDLPVFEPTGSVVDDIETMAAWMEEANSIQAKLPRPKLLQPWFSKRMPPVSYEEFDPINNVDPYIQGATGTYGYTLDARTHTIKDTKMETHWRADGVVSTKDGLELRFDFGETLEYSGRHTTSVSAYENGITQHYIDPLVISLDTGAPTLSNSYFSFDLDGDGSEEALRMLAPGSGFLCLDKNMDGTINNGNELFGPSMGDGFRELLNYDKDENWWIDEDDAVFEKLKFWENDGSGKMTLKTLKEAGIGAIYLEKTQTSFHLKDNSGHSQAVIKNSGIALREDGSVIAVREMDWVV